ncbi:hypothetical protein C8R44DRAFT_735073 [Mycena epipterygia]|nr:hypothetical protein C8R44DRAFT_735073 [Mycena epipterygia]
MDNFIHRTRFDFRISKVRIMDALHARTTSSGESAEFKTLLASYLHTIRRLLSPPPAPALYLRIWLTPYASCKPSLRLHTALKIIWQRINNRRGHALLLSSQNLQKSSAHRDLNDCPPRNWMMIAARAGCGGIGAVSARHSTLFVIATINSSPSYSRSRRCSRHREKWQPQQQTQPATPTVRRYVTIPPDNCLYTPTYATQSVLPTAARRRRRMEMVAS